jgi:hypothetical protein
MTILNVIMFYQDWHAILDIPWEPKNLDIQYICGDCATSINRNHAKFHSHLPVFWCDFSVLDKYFYNQYKANKFQYNPLYWSKT